MKLGALVVSHHKKFRRDLAQLVELVDSCVEVVGEVGTARDALTQIASLQPELVLLDMNLWQIRTLELTKRIHAQWPGTAVVVIGNEPAIDYRDSALEAGAIEYVDVLEIASQLPAALLMIDRPEGCSEQAVSHSAPTPADTQRSLPLVNFRSRLRTAPTGPKHGPYTAWQYVHICLGLVLASVILNLESGPDMGTVRSLVLMLALVGIATMEVRQFARARHAADALGHHPQTKGGAIANSV